MFLALMLAIALEDGAVRVSPHGDNRFMLLLTVAKKDVPTAYAKIQAAIDATCGVAGLKSKLPVAYHREKKPPRRYLFAQFVTCNALAKPAGSAD